MEKQVTVRQNVERILRHLGISNVSIYETWKDRVWAICLGDNVERKGKQVSLFEAHCIDNAWICDNSAPFGDQIVASEHHAGGRSYRWDHVPSLQAVFYSWPDGRSTVEMDTDEAPPQRDVISALHHLFGEVIPHAITHGTTRPEKIALMLDKSIGEEHASV